MTYTSADYTDLSINLSKQDNVLRLTDQFFIMNKMQNHQRDLGERRSVHRASLAWVWLLALAVAPLALVTAVAALFAFNSIFPVLSESNRDALGRIPSFVCLGAAGLLLLLAAGACISDFRKWLATRTAGLIIYQNGFTYKSKGHMETCHWDEIKHIDFRFIEVKAKHSAPRKVSVIRSIVKTDGTVISPAETLNLQKITNVVKTARGAASTVHPMTS